MVRHATFARGQQPSRLARMARMRAASLAGMRSCCLADLDRGRVVEGAMMQPDSLLSEQTTEGIIINGDPPTSDAENCPGGSGGAFAPDTMDIRLTALAMNELWPMSPVARAAAIKRLEEAVANP